MFLELVITVITLLVVIDYLVKKRRCDVIGDLPGPPAYPIFGNSLMYINRTQEEILNMILKNRKKFGPLYRVWIFNQLAVFSCDFKDVEVIMSSSQHIAKNTMYNILTSWLGDGLLMSTGPKWHSRRKIITPTFHFKILEQFAEVFDQQSAVLVERLRPMADGKTEFNIQPFVCLAALDIIAETAMGTKLNAQTDGNCGYVQAVTEITDIISKRFVSTLQRSELVFSITSPFTKRRQEKAIEVMHDFTEMIIKDRRNELQATLKKSEETGILNVNNDIGVKKRLALLDVLLQSTIDGKPLSNDDIREEVDTFMFEGHDTTTSGMVFTLYLLSRHASVQDKAFQEIREVIGDDRSIPVAYRDLQNLKYLECVIKESMRMYPPVPIIGRHITTDIELNGRKIPAGTNYTIGIFAMCREETVFPDPDSFIPERHMSDDTGKLHPFAYIPFSAGPRNCIGQKFAMLEMKSTISKILRHYELLPLGPGVKPIVNLVLRSANGVHLGLRERVY